MCTGEPALRSLHDIWSTPAAFLILILLTSLVIGSVFVGLKSKSMLFFGAFFRIRSMLGWLFSSSSRQEFLCGSYFDGSFESF
jgi:hypothetical protein